MTAKVKKIKKTEYVWKVKEVKGVHETALKYEVSLTLPKRKKPGLRVIGFKSDDVMGQVAELKEGLPPRIVDALGRELEVSRKEFARVAGVADQCQIGRAHV